MTFESNGQHRSHRSGGVHKRKNGEIFVNAFQGKLAEFAVYELLQDCDGIQSPDLSVHPLGTWDSADLIIDKFSIAVKSTKSYGNLLLLETSDWTIEAEYSNNSSELTPDFFALVRIDPDIERLMKDDGLFFSNIIDKKTLTRIILDSKHYTYDCCGIARKSDFKIAIQNGNILPKGSMLNNATKMDAENFYIQAGDLRPIDSITEVNT